MDLLIILSPVGLLEYLNLIISLFDSWFGEL
jgi:hypothetical protein